MGHVTKNVDPHIGLPLRTRNPFARSHTQQSRLLWFLIFAPEQILEIVKIVLAIKSLFDINATPTKRSGAQPLVETENR